MMSKLDALRAELGQSSVRAMSLRYWPEGPKLTECEHLIASTVSLLELWPAKVWIYKEQFGSHTSKRWRASDDVKLAEFESIVGITGDSGKPLSKANLRSRLGLFSIRTPEDIHGGKVYFEHALDFLTIDLGLKVISTWLTVITPRFGFSNIGTKDSAIPFHAGQPTRSDDEVYLKRIRAHEVVRHCEPYEDGYLGKRLLDVFELNILSPAHLSSRVFGTSLEDWIGSGSRGTLTQLKKDVCAWIVPNNIRPDVRQNLLKGGYLIVPV